jgi:hypothetical protein
MIISHLYYPGSLNVICGGAGPFKEELVPGTLVTYVRNRNLLGLVLFVITRDNAMFETLKWDPDSRVDRIVRVAWTTYIAWDVGAHVC